MVMCVWADGVKRTPRVLYVYNATFRRDCKPTRRRTAQVARLDSLLRHFGIESDQAVFVGVSKNEGRVCVGEGHAPVRRFVEKHEIPEDSGVVTDHGTAYFLKDEDVSHTLGFKTHTCHATVVCQ